MVEEHRIRLVALGGGGTGKSSIVKRFLFNTFCDKHRPTVEDLYCREFDLETTTLKVDILDTAGDFQFPAMRRLSIATGHAFLLVYSIDDPVSFQLIKECFEEIRHAKSDFQDIPIVVVGNKTDLGEDQRQVIKEDVTEWLFCELPRLKVKLVECSAKENNNIKEIFRSFLQLSKIPIPIEGLRRRSSAHAAPSAIGKNSLSPHLAEGGGEGGSEAFVTQRSKPRSRSLIRRASKKVSKMRESAHAASANVDDCCIS